MTYELRAISNDELRWALLPPPGREDLIFRFAMTFNSYTAFESQDAGSQSEDNIRANVDPLTYARHRLFKSARASRHRMDDRFIGNYVDLLPVFQHLLPDSPPRRDRLEDHFGVLYPPLPAANGNH